MRGVVRLYRREVAARTLSQCIEFKDRDRDIYFQEAIRTEIGLAVDEMRRVGDAHQMSCSGSSARQLGFGYAP